MASTPTPPWLWHMCQDYAQRAELSGPVDVVVSRARPMKCRVIRDEGRIVITVGSRWTDRDSISPSLGPLIRAPLAHELAHAARGDMDRAPLSLAKAFRHGLARTAGLLSWAAGLAAMATSILGGTVAGLGGRALPLTGYAFVLGGMAGRQVADNILLPASESRARELKADAFAVRLIGDPRPVEAALRYSNRGLTGLLTRHLGNRTPLSSHPRFSERISNIRATGEDLQRNYWSEPSRGHSGGRAWPTPAADVTDPVVSARRDAERPGRRWTVRPVSTTETTATPSAPSRPESTKYTRSPGGSATGLSQ